MSVWATMSGAAVAQGIPLDGIVVTSTKTSEAAIDALSGTSVLDKEQLDQQFQADRPAHLPDDDAGRYDVGDGPRYRDRRSTSAACRTSGGSTC